MYLSRVEINPYRRETARALSSPQIMHAAVMASFPSFSDSPGRVMWRVDRLGSATYIIVQSDIKPDFSHILDQFGRPAADAGWETVDYDSFLSKLENGQIWRFRLKANPTHSLPSNEGHRGKVVAHVTEAHQMSWLLSKAEKLGFSILDDNIIIRHRGTSTFDHNGGKITLVTATFEGILKIEDIELFRSCMVDGIGRGKAYGCGLLTLARI